MQRVGVCVQRVGVYHWIRLRGWSRLHIDDVDDGGFIPSVIQFPEHLAPGAAHAETGSGDVFAERPLSRVRCAYFNQHPELWNLPGWQRTLILYLFLMEALRAKAAGGGPNSGSPKAAVRLRLVMSHNGRQAFSPNLDETVHARQGQHQKP